MGPERIYPPRLREEQAAEEQRQLTRRRRQRFVAFLVVGLLLVCILGFLGYGLLSRVSSSDSQQREERGAYMLPGDEHIQVEVLNACDVPGVAETVSQHLRKAGFDVASYGNAAETEPFSLVLDRMGDSLAALRVALAMDIAPDRVVRKIDSSRFVKATVLLGRDYRTLAPFD